MTPKYLQPAAIWKDQIISEYKKFQYTTKALNLTCQRGQWYPDIPDMPKEGEYHWAVVNKEGELVGYIKYFVEFYDGTAGAWAIVSFKPNRELGLSIRYIMNELINKFHIHKISFGVRCGNPVERHYDKFASKFEESYKHIFYDCFKDAYGNYQSIAEYEIFPFGISKSE